MAVVRKCSGEGCSTKDSCFRFKVKLDPVMQLWVQPPLKERGIACKHYIHAPTKGMVDKLFREMVLEVEEWQMGKKRRFNAKTGKSYKDGNGEH